MDPFSFVENQVDSFIHMQLLDLARVLTKRNQLNLEFSFHSYFDVENNTLAVSQFWDDYGLEDRMYGWKSDVYLRAMGGAAFSDVKKIEAYLNSLSEKALPHFGKQLFALCEDIRLEAIISQRRPGTTRIFAERSRLYTSYFTKRIQSHLMRREEADAVFAAIYVWFAADVIDGHLPEFLSRLMEALKPHLEKVSSAKSTGEVLDLCEQMLISLEAVIMKDMTANYFSTQRTNGTVNAKQAESCEEWMRSPKLTNDDKVEMSKPDDIDNPNEKLPMWHKESPQPAESFLQFDLEQGAKTDLMGDAARESDAADQAVGLVQGSTQFSTKNDFSDQEALKRRLSEVSLKREVEEFGAANHSARPVYTPIEPLSSEQIAAYRALVEQISPLQRKLKRTIEITLEQKKIATSLHLPYGRLGKKLIPFVTEEKPKLFYKKASPSRTMDAAFLLLVDCSASMFDKMEETRRGIALFHETLRSLQIPHAVVGFWEDSDSGSDQYFPNHFQMVIDFEQSVNPCGAGIMQLSPKQDNRDGYAIRVMTKHLMKRGEKQRVILVFSDGEPAAANYAEEGILDTYQAVHQARRLGIEVMSIFLGNGEIKEKDRRTMQNIYGKFSIVVPKLDELPLHLKPILAKLLNKAI